MSFNEDWEEKIFSDVVNIDPTISLSKGEKAKYIGMADISEYNKNIRNYEIKEYKGGSKFKNGDTLMARITPSLENGKTAYVDILNENEIAFGSTEFIVLRGKKNLTDNQFVYYLSITPRIRKHAIKSMTGTSGRQRVQKEIFDKITIKLPSIKEQKGISDFLASIDKKIENNNKMNKTLEEMAQAIFKSWFIDFEPFQEEFVESELGLIPENWEAIAFKKLFEFNKGKTPKDKSKENKKGYLKYLTISVLSGKKNVYGKPTKNNILVKEDDIVMVMDGSRSGKIFFGLSGIVASTLSKINLVNKRITKGFIYLLLKYHENEFMNNTTGSAVPHADKKYILNKKIALPKEDNLLDNLNELIQNIRTKISKNKKENKYLKELKDTLLPKLMSGEIRVTSEK